MNNGIPPAAPEDKEQNASKNSMPRRFFFWLRRHIFGFLALISLELMFHTGKLALDTAKNMTVRSVGFLGFFLFLGLFVLFMRRWLPVFWNQSPLILRLRAAVRRILGRFGAFVAKKLGLNRRGDMLWGERTVRYRVDGLAEREKKAERRLPRWKNLPDDSARVRYLFAYTLLASRANGVKVLRSHTPRELAACVAHTDERRKLFSLYDEARYSGRLLTLGEERINGLVAAAKDVYTGQREEKKRKR